jgi:hypothetical protein
MDAGAQVKRPLTQLNHEIEELESQASRLTLERAAITGEVARAGRRLRYFRLAQVFRQPRASFEMWPTAALILGPLASGILVFMLVHLLSGSFALALIGLVLGLAAGTALFASLLYRPPDALLPAAIADAESGSRLADARLKEKLERLAETNAQLKKLVDERRDQIASGKLQRAALLQRNWKAMHDAEWEDFVVEVLRTHGANVDRSGRTGDQEPNLIVDFGTHRALVLTQGKGETVNSGTIQKVLAAKDRERCNRCAVIINHRFTGAAQDFAERNGCTAVGVGEFPDFVLGKMEL